MEVLVVIAIASLAVFGVYLVAIGVFGGLNRLAIASFMFSILWLYALGSLLGLILGVVAVRRIDASTERGHGLAVAGIILGAGGLVVTVIAFVIAVQAVNEL